MTDIAVLPITEASGKTVLLVSDNPTASGNRYLMSALLKNRIPTKMLILKFDHADNVDALLSLIRELNVGVVGISLFSTRRMEFRSITGRIKAAFPETFVVCGGPDVNTNYLNALDWADFVCLFDGEIAFPDLCRQLLSNTPKQDIPTPGIAYRLDGRVVENPPQPHTSLDEYAFPYFSDENMFLISQGVVSHHKDSSQTVYNVYASRGCFYKCTYCANHVFSSNFPGKTYYRYRSVDNVIDEILTVLSKMPHVKTITFHDEQFGVNNKWFDEFEAKYRSRINKPFFVQMNPNTITREKIRRLKDLGLQMMSFGMQSASERMRKIYRRPESLAQIRSANQLLHELRVTHFFDIIVDNPYESEEDVEATVRFLLTLKKPFFAKTFDLVHLPGTELTAMLLKDNKITANQIEGNFKYDDDIAWRVHEGTMSAAPDGKYLVALIQLTGSVLIPNVLLTGLLRVKGWLPPPVKVVVSKMVLSNWFYRNQLMVNTVASMVRDRGVGPVALKIWRRLAA